MRTAVCPGSFDPVTKGHIDIIERAAKMFDIIDVAIFNNPNKDPLFSFEERVDMLKQATDHIPNVQISCFSGLLNVYVREIGSNIIVRGLRALTDFEYEFQRALLIKKIDPVIETVFMMTNSEYSYISSSGVKELAKFGGDTGQFVPACVEKKLREKLKAK